MEAFADVVTTTCPSAFGGVSGNIFLNVITALIATHCTIVNDYKWPIDKADDIIASAKEGLSYDFIVVGAGTAGSIVASRLSNIYPKSSVLLVEAGEDPGLDSEIPAFLFNVHNSSNDWSYKIEPDGNSCLGFEDSSCTWNKGKGMGGSSSINAMLYIRGHPKDFDEWKQMGNNGWGYNDLKYYFELVEKTFNISNVDKTDNAWYKVIDDAWKQLQFTSYNYDGHEALIGTRKAYLLTKHGKRLNTAKVVLNEAKNLHVIKNTLVQSITLDKESARVKSISVRHSNGLATEILVNKELILSAGSIGSPQILMRSGIGPKEHLEEIGVPCNLNLPVGQNLQDHLVLSLFMKTNKHDTITPEMMNLFFLQYMSMRTGPISNTGITDFFGFVDTKNSSNYPNIQIFHAYFFKNDAIGLRQFLQGPGFSSEVVEHITALNKNHGILCLFPTLLHPKSKGEILLRDANSLSRPVIKANYLNHSDDMESLIKAIDFVHKLEKTDAFKSLTLEILQINISKCSTFKFNTRPYWECYIRHMATTVYHPVGTVKMGNDNLAVVDNKLKVHGLKNLRVVDASIMPKIPGANTMAATLAVAYKAVDLITSNYNYKEEL